MWLTSFNLQTTFKLGAICCLISYMKELMNLLKSHSKLPSQDLNPRDMALESRFLDTMLRYIPYRCPKYHPSSTLFLLDQTKMWSKSRKKYRETGLISLIQLLNQYPQPSTFTLQSVRNLDLIQFFCISQAECILTDWPIPSQWRELILAWATWKSIFMLRSNTEGQCSTIVQDSFTENSWSPASVRLWTQLHIPFNYLWWTLSPIKLKHYSKSFLFFLSSLDNNNHIRDIA